MADNFQYVAGQNFYLSGNGVAASDTTITLKSFKFPNSDDLITMSDFGSIGYGTLEPGTSRREFFSFTGVTQNANGSATLTGVTKGLDAAAPYTEVAALKKGHGGGTLVRIANTPQFYNKFANKDNDETINQTWTFSTANFPKMSDGTTAPTNDEDLATKKYVDDTSAGVPVSINRIVVEGNAGEVVAAGNLVYLDTADTEWKLVDATDTSTLYGVELGIAQGAGTDGNSITGGVLVQGLDSNQAGLATNNLAYATDVGGTIGTAAGTNEKVIGYVYSATQVVFDPDFSPTLTPDEKDALAGTSGTPSAANKYVTDDDTATTGASVVVRSKANSKVDDSLVALTTEGDIVYSDGTDLQRLPIGTGTQVLTVNSGATAPEWGTRGSQSIFTVGTADGTDYTVTGQANPGTYVEVDAANLSATINVPSVGSAILIRYGFNMKTSSGTDDVQTRLQDTTNGNTLFTESTTSTSFVEFNNEIIYIAPSTSFDLELQFKTTGGVGIINTLQNSSVSVIDTSEVPNYQVHVPIS